MKLSVFDLHCDTAMRMLDEGQGFSDNSFAVSLEQAKGFDRYVQVMAHFIDDSLSDDDGWQYFLDMNHNLLLDASVTKGHVQVVKEAPVCWKSRSMILALEDARILCNDISRVDFLHSLGIRIITPTWAGKSCIGGAHNTNEGLTEFGKKALSRALQKGILLDISHASVRSSKEIFALCHEHGVPVIASHSNAYSVCPVSRNLRNDQIQELLQSGGIIGLNLHMPFLSTKKTAGIADLLLHIDFFLEQGCADALCLGMDMDGCDLPRELSSLSALQTLAEELLRLGYSENLIHAIFFENADRFFQKHLGQPRNR